MDVIEPRPPQAGVKLVISVDTGIRAFAAAETASRVGVDLIVTDQSPARSERRRSQGAGGTESQSKADVSIPVRSFAAAGVAFKVAQKPVRTIQGRCGPGQADSVIFKDGWPLPLWLTPSR